jgi:NAD(P)H-nitrite reductase large subunit
VIVCHCAVVTDREVIACIAAGAGNVADISRATSAGRSCGGCVPTLRALACQHFPLARTSFPEVASATA